MIILIIISKPRVSKKKYGKEKREEAFAVCRISKSKWQFYVMLFEEEKILQIANVVKL